MVRSLQTWLPSAAWLLAALFVVCFAAPLRAQEMLDLTDPDSKEFAGQIEALFQRPRAADTLSCSVAGREPTLNFAFRYYASYRVSLPVRQFSEDAVSLRMLLRVTSLASGERSYFVQDSNIPPGVRPRSATGRFGGGFLIGEGRYRVDWMLLGTGQRSCRGDWEVSLRLKPEERDAADFVPAGQVSPLEFSWTGAHSRRNRPFRVAVILHAAPVHPRSIKLTSYDQSFFTTMLAALLEDTPFLETSLYAVSLDKQDVIFENPGLEVKDFDKLLDAMGALNLGTIGAEQYFNPRGRQDVLAELVNREIAAPEPPDAIVFIGPNTRHMEKFPQELIESVPGRKPKFFYLHLDYFSRRYPWPDTIERLTKSQGGKVFSIRHPRELIRALEKMERILASEAGGES